MRILLISPRWAGFGNRKKVKVREKKATPLTLGILAGLSREHQVVIVDEHAQKIPFHEPWDLVGITSTTYKAPRAYEIADSFKSLGVQVIVGGIHPTLQPDQCLEHCSSVVTGEAEPVWNQVLHDAARQQLAPIYNAGILEDLSKVPFARRDLYRPGQNPTYFQATRGCGWTCRFCYLQEIPGWNPFRRRPIDQVIDELRAVKQSVIAIVDDNLFIDRQYALDLFEAMTTLGKFWWAQAPSTICLDDQLLNAASRSGCFALSIGFQTINEASLDQARVKQNRIAQYCDQVQNVKNHDILVDSTWIFGFDDDPPTIFNETVEAIREMGVDAYSLYFLTAYPGTAEYTRFEETGRIVDFNLAHYDWDHPTIQPPQMTITELAEGVAQAYRRLDGSGLRWLGRQLIRNNRLLRRSPGLAAYLLKNTFYQSYRVDY
ncbi:MAG: radical SAM protein [Candidatus Neomarinimicrobiota bacterium]